MGTETIRAAIYVRQSVREDQGISQQIAECMKRADAEGWAVAGIYDDNATSATKYRGEGTAWARMLADVDAGRLDLIVSVAAARLLRRVEDVLEITGRGVRVVTLRDGIDTGSTFGKAILYILVALAESEIEEKEARAIPYRAARREAGHPSPGRVPFGYEWVPKAKRDAEGIRYVIREDEAGVLRWMSSAFLAGESLGEIARGLNDAGTTTRQGKPWGASTVRRSLLSPFPAALLPPPMPDGVHYKPELADLTQAVPGAWEPILAEDAVLAARHRLLTSEAHQRSHDGNTRPKWLLSGVGRCGACGGALRSCMTKTTATSERGYRCTKGCFQRPAALIEAYIGDSVIDVLSASESLRRADDPGPDMAALRARREAIEAKRAAWFTRVKAGTLTPEQWDELAEGWTAEIHELDAALADALQADPLAEILDADDVRGVWESLSTGRRRVILSALAEWVAVHPVGKGKRVRTVDQTHGTVTFRWKKQRKIAKLDGTGTKVLPPAVPADAGAAISQALSVES